MRKLFISLILLFLVGCGGNVNSPLVKKKASLSSKKVIENKVVTNTTPVIKHKIVIALLLPLNGTYSKTSEKIIEGVFLAYNSSSLKKNIIIKIFNTNENNKDSSKQAALNAVESKAKIILGPLRASSLAQVNKVTEPLGITVLALSNNRSALYKTQNTYLIGLTFASEVERIVDYIVNVRFAKNFIALVPHSVYGDILASDLIAAIKARNLKLIKIISYPKDTVDFRPYINGLINKEDAIKYKAELSKYTENNQTNYSSLMKNGKDRPILNLRFDTLFIGDYGKRLDMMSTYLPFADISTKSINIIGVRSWAKSNPKHNPILKHALYSNTPSFNNTIFYSEFNNIYKTKPNIISAITFDFMNMIINLVSNAIDSNNIKNGFNKLSVTSYKGFGVLGSFQLRSDGLVQRDLVVEQFNGLEDNIIDNTSGYDYMKVTNYQRIPILLQPLFVKSNDENEKSLLKTIKER